MEEVWRKRMIGALETFAAQVTKVAREVGTEGKLGGQVKSPMPPAYGARSPITSTSLPPT
jgi:hypothetical protein